MISAYINLMQEAFVSELQTNIAALHFIYWTKMVCDAHKCMHADCMDTYFVCALHYMTCESNNVHTYQGIYIYIW